MNKRWIAAFMMIIVIVGIFCGCKNRKGAAETTAPAEETGLTASLTLVCPIQGTALDAIGVQLADFKTRFPNVDVQLLTDPEAEGNIVLTSADEAYRYCKEDKLMDMTLWVEDDGFVLDRTGAMSQLGLTEENKNDLVELFYEEGRLFEDNSLYMMPFYRETLLLYYNQTFMEENELETPFTWEEVEKICAAVKETNPDSTPLVINDIRGTFISMCVQYGANYDGTEGIAGLLSGQGAVKSLTMLNDWYAKGYMKTAEQLGREAKVSDEGVYLVIDSNANSKNHAPATNNDAFAFEMGAINMPHFAEVSGKVLVNGPGFVLFRSEDDDQMLAAWLLIKHLALDSGFQAKLAMSGSLIPVLTSAETNEEYSHYLDIANGDENVDSLAALVCLEQQHTFFTVPAYDGSLADESVINQLIDTCITATGDVVGQIEAAVQAAIVG